jgi:hypothetical protein
MTEARERELLARVPTLGCMEEITAFQQAIVKNDGPLTTSLYAALIERAAQLGHKYK